jgi:dihydropteroate synthase
MPFLDFRRPVPGAERDGGVWRLSWRGTAVMGILNVTPDSFSDGGEYLRHDAALEKARHMAAKGALVVDIGGESTRPGAESVSSMDEMARILPVIEALAREGQLVVSVDTAKPEVARAALEVGAHLVNDVTGLRDPAMRAVCAEFGVPAVIMHMRGEPRTMQQNPTYVDVAAEVFGFLREQAARALAEGVPGVLLDPGIGFGKTREHNLTLLRALPDLGAGQYPVLVGASRKRLIDYIADVPDARDRDPGSIALHLHAAACGVAMVRVHDVAGHVQALRVGEAIRAK